MPGEMPDWRAHEDYVAEAISGEKTVTSGNKWWDISDVVNRDGSTNSRAQFMADAKSTLKDGYRVSKKFVRQYREKAILRGKVFLLPLRFQDGHTGEVDDWVVIHMDDFRELLGLDVRAQSIAEKKELDDHESSLQGLLADIAEKLEALVSDRDLSQSARKMASDAVDAIDEAADFIQEREA